MAPDATRLGGFPAATFTRARAIPAGNTLGPLDSAGNVGSLHLGDGRRRRARPDQLPGPHQRPAQSRPLLEHCLQRRDDDAARHPPVRRRLTPRRRSGRRTRPDQLPDTRLPTATTPPARRHDHDLDSAGDVGSHSVTVGADGLGLISYYDDTNADLKVAHCSNPACTAATLTTLDSAGHVGSSPRSRSGPTASASSATTTPPTQRPQGRPLQQRRLHERHHRDPRQRRRRRASSLSITIGSRRPRPHQLLRHHQRRPQGRPLRRRRLHQRHHHDPGQRRLRGLRYTSITIGADGRGLISYHDATNGDLKVAHCGNAGLHQRARLTTLDSAARRPIQLHHDRRRRPRPHSPTRQHQRT